MNLKAWAGGAGVAVLMAVLTLRVATRVDTSPTAAAVSARSASAPARDPGCTDNVLIDGRDARPVGARVGGRLRRPVTGAPRSLSYYAANAVDTAEIHRLISDRLATRDDEDPTRFNPELATCVRPIPLGWEITLRDGVRWADPADGALTSADLEMALAVVAAEENGGRASAMRAALGRFEVEVVDARRVAVRFNAPAPGQLANLLAIQPVPARRFGGPSASSNYADHMVTDFLVGTGPYVVAAGTGDDLRFTRNPTYWADPAAFDEIVHVVAPDPSGWPRLVGAGAVDVAFLRAEAWRELAPATPPLGDPALAVTFAPTSSWFYIGYRLEDPRFSDVRVRRALSMALDREALARGVFAGLGEVISGPFDPRSPCYDQAIQPLPFDLDAAARLLDDAGFTTIDGDGDGVRSRGAVRLAFDLHIWAGSSDWEAVGEIWRGALAPLGVAVRVIPVASPAMQEVLDGRRFDTFAGSWAPDPEIELRQQWHSAESAGANRVGLRDDEVDRLIADSETGGPEDRPRACRALHARLHELQPMLFVYARQRVPVLHRRGLGLTFPAAEPVRDARRWAWTEEPE